VLNVLVPDETAVSGRACLFCAEDLGPSDEAVKEIVAASGESSAVDLAAIVSSPLSYREGQQGVMSSTVHDSLVKNVY
jgi:hypothetical protein